MEEKTTVEQEEKETVETESDEQKPSGQQPREISMKTLVLLVAALGVIVMVMIGAFGKGGQEEAHKFIDNLQLFSLLANVADVKSLVIHPATTTHSQCTAEELLDQGIKPNTVRLSIGTEHIDDIIGDLENAFAAIK